MVVPKMKQIYYYLLVITFALIFLFKKDYWPPKRKQNISMCILSVPSLTLFPIMQLDAIKASSLLYSSFLSFSTLTHSLLSGTQFKTVVEYAPSQRVAKHMSKKDGREGTIYKGTLHQFSLQHMPIFFFVT